MIDKLFYLDFPSLLSTLKKRLAETAPSRIQLVCGPRQVGKTTALLELEKMWGEKAIYVTMDSPEAQVQGFWERLWTRAANTSSDLGTIVVLIDEVQHLQDWSVLLKSEWDRIVRFRLPIHVVASGSSSLQLDLGSKESLAGRFERLTLPHWSASSIASVYKVKKDEAVQEYVTRGSYPGAFQFRNEPNRWKAYVRDSIIEPAIGRDILALNAIRRPALLRQIFAITATIPAQIFSLQKLQGQLQDSGALATIAHYLELLENAFLIAVLRKYTNKPLRFRESPPKFVVLNQAICAAYDPRGIPTRESDPQRFGFWIENACLAHLWNSGRNLMYWREEPYEVDAIVNDEKSKWAIEVKTGPYSSQDLKGLLEFTSRYPNFKPLVVCDEGQETTAARLGVETVSWREFLLKPVP